VGSLLATERLSQRLHSCSFIFSASHPFLLLHTSHLTPSIHQVLGISTHSPLMECPLLDISHWCGCPVAYCPILMFPALKLSAYSPVAQRCVKLTSTAFDFVGFKADIHVRSKVSSPDHFAGLLSRSTTAFPPRAGGRPPGLMPQLSFLSSYHGRGSPIATLDRLLHIESPLGFLAIMGVWVGGVAYGDGLMRALTSDFNGTYSALPGWYCSVAHPHGFNVRVRASSDSLILTLVASFRSHEVYCH
jgi:hypothetical protein